MSTISNALGTVFWSPWDPAHLMTAYSNTPTAPWDKLKDLQSQDLLICISENIRLVNHKTGERNTKVGGFWVPNPYLAGSVKTLVTKHEIRDLRSKRLGLTERDLGRLNWIVMENDRLSMEEQAASLDALSAALGEPLSLVVMSGDARPASIASAGVETAQKGKSLHAYILLDSVSVDRLDTWLTASRLVTLLIGGDGAMNKPAQLCRYPGQVITHDGVTRIQTVLHHDFDKKWDIDDLVVKLQAEADRRGIDVPSALAALKMADAFDRMGDTVRAKRVATELRVTEEDRQTYAANKGESAKGTKLDGDLPVWVQGRETTVKDWIESLESMSDDSKGQWLDSTCPLHPHGTHGAGSSRWGSRGVMCCRKYGDKYHYNIEVSMTAFDIVTETPKSRIKAKDKTPKKVPEKMGDYSDLGTKARALPHLEGRLCQLPNSERYSWTGNSWERGDAYVNRLLVNVHQTVSEEFLATIPGMPEKFQEAAAVYGMRLRNAATLQTIRSLALPLIPVVKGMNPDPMKLNTTTGALDLLDGGVEPAAPEHYATALATAYVPAADCPRFEAFIDEVFPDAETRAWVQRFAGYCLTGQVTGQVFTIFHGDGANGKSTLVNAIAYAMGTYAKSLPARVLMGKSTHPTEILDLMGARLVYINETANSDQLDAAMVKSFTSEEPLRARAIGKDTTEFVPTHKVIMSTNYPPKLSQSDVADAALHRRVRVVPFTTNFRDKPDPTLERQLKAEASGILNWMVQGLRELQGMGYTKGLAASPQMLEQTKSWIADNDGVQDFLDRNIVSDTGAYTTNESLWLRYVDDCEMYKIPQTTRIKTIKSLVAHLEQHKLEKVRKNSSRGFRCSMLPIVGVGRPVDPADPYLLNQQLDLTQGNN